jgi:hypothetical protein
VAIALATLLPSPGDEAHGWTGCLLCGERGGADALLNVVLFVPLGVALALGGMRGLRCLLAGALVSMGVEAAQAVVPGRDPSPPDVLFNALGAGAGALFPRRGAALLRAPWAAPAAALLPGAAVLLTAQLTAPSPPAGPLYGQWTPDLRGPRYLGRVLDAQVGAVPVPPARLRDPGALRGALRRGDPVALRVVAGPPPRWRSPVLRAVNADGDEAFRLDAVGPDLRVEFRMRAADLRLDHPALRVPGVLRHARPGDTLRVEVSRPGRAVQVRVDGAPAAPVGFTPGSGWALLSAGALGVPFRGALGAVWLALLHLPLGLVLRRRPAPALLLAPLAALLALPPLTGLLPAPPAELLGAALGIAAGILLRR